MEMKNENGGRKAERALRRPSGGREARTIARLLAAKLTTRSGPPRATEPPAAVDGAAGVAHGVGVMVEASTASSPLPMAVAACMLVLAASPASGAQLQSAAVPKASSTCTNGRCRLDGQARPTTREGGTCRHAILSRPPRASSRSDMHGARRNRVRMRVLPACVPPLAATSDARSMSPASRTAAPRRAKKRPLSARWECCCAAAAARADHHRPSPGLTSAAQPPRRTHGPATTGVRPRRPQWHRLLLIHHSDDRHSDWHGRSRVGSLAGLLGASATMNPPSRPARVQSGGREQRWARVCWPGLACQQFQLASSACGWRAHRRRAVSTTLRWKYRSRHRGRRPMTDVLLAKLGEVSQTNCLSRVPSRIWCTCEDGRR